jgi:signal transduction histidine kinase
MNALELVTAMAHAIYVVIFVLVLWRALRHPTPAHTDMAFFFGLTAVVILTTRIEPLFGSPPVWVADIVLIALMAIPYALLRLVNDFASARPSVTRFAEVGLLVCAAATIAFSGAPPAPVLLAMVTYFAAVAVYCSVVFVREARRSRGVTRRRLESVSMGSLLIGTTILLSGITPFVGDQGDAVLNGLVQVCALGSGLAYYLGFAPPATLKRAWQAPEVDAFLSRAAELPTLPTTADVVRELERHAAAATGAYATVGVWDEAREVLVFHRSAPPYATVDVRPGQLAGGRAFAAQRVEFSSNPARDHPEGAETYRASGVAATISAPITRSDRRLGVLCIFAPRPPFFAVSDMELVQLLADQAAAILDARALAEKTGSVRAREEAARLKEDFLSAAAHDLKTPLTAIVGRAQLIARRARREPDAPADLDGLDLIVQQTKRLGALVNDLLDGRRLDGTRRSRNEQGQVDLSAIVAGAAARQDPSHARVHVDAAEAIHGDFDGRRIEQLVDNLIENALKYSEASVPVSVRVWREADEARIDVRDEGIGIPDGDLTTIFDRFARGSNVDEARYHGTGLGLYICRGVVEEHGGRIWAESQIGTGSVFHVALPLRRPDPEGSDRPS